MTEFLAILTGILKFWDEVTWLVKQLQGTPEEHREKIQIKIGEEFKDFKRTGRPTWD